ncbi:MAG: aminotransferase class III-fold pyridoxal phosphate-dependent enzyme [Pirellulaceae bacterium]
MIATLGLEDITGLSYLCSGNEKFQAVIEQVAARQAGSIAVQRRATAQLSGTPSLLTYEAPMLPLAIDRASGARITDVDGHEYLDCHSVYTANLLGHNPPFVRAAVLAALERGVGGGHLFAEQAELGELIQQMVPGVERSAFFHTGGESIQAAVRLARLATGRQKVAKFEGCYHGSAEFLLHNTWMILAGTAPKAPVDQIPPCPDTGGVRTASSEELLVLPFNSSVALELLDRHAEELACVVVDPVPSFMTNWVPEAREFVQQIGAVCHDRVPVIFDEVVCGFRLARGGAREWSGVTPQMSCFGKVTAGLGLPLSILAGDSRFLDGARTAGLFRDYRFRKAWLSSTFSSAFLPVVASLAQLRYIGEHHAEIVARLDQNHRHLQQRLRDFAGRSGIPVDLQGHSRLQMQLSIGKSEPTEKSYRGMMTTASPAQLRTLLALTLYLRLHGVYCKTIPTMNLSAAFTSDDIDQLAASIEASLCDMQRDAML